MLLIFHSVFLGHHMTTFKCFHQKKTQSFALPEWKWDHKPDLCVPSGLPRTPTQLGHHFSLTDIWPNPTASITKSVSPTSLMPPNKTRAHFIFISVWRQTCLSIILPPLLNSTRSCHCRVANWQTHKVNKVNFQIHLNPQILSSNHADQTHVLSL